MLGDVTPSEFQGIEVKTNQLLAKKLLTVLNPTPSSEYTAIQQTAHDNQNLCWGKVFIGITRERHGQVLNPKFNGYCQRHNSQNSNFSTATSTATICTSAPVTSAAMPAEVTPANEEKIPSSDEAVFDGITHEQLVSSLKDLALKGDLQRSRCSLLKKAMEDDPYSRTSNNQGVQASLKTEKNIKSTIHSSNQLCRPVFMPTRKIQLTKGMKLYLKGKKQATKEKLQLTQSSVGKTDKKYSEQRGTQT